MLLNKNQFILLIFLIKVSNTLSLSNNCKSLNNLTL